MMVMSAMPIAPASTPMISVAISIAVPTILHKIDWPRTSSICTAIPRPIAGVTRWNPQIDGLVLIAGALNQQRLLVNQRWPCPLPHINLPVKIRVTDSQGKPNIRSVYRASEYNTQGEQ